MSNAQSNAFQKLIQLAASSTDFARESLADKRDRSLALQRMGEEFRSKREELGRKRAEIARVQSEVGDAQKGLEEMQGRRAALGAELDQLQQRGNEQRTAIEAAQSAHQAQADDLQLEIARRQRERDQLEADGTRLQRENADLRVQAESRRTERDLLQAETANLRLEILRLEQVRLQDERRITEAAQRSVDDLARKSREAEDVARRKAAVILQDAREQAAEIEAGAYRPRGGARMPPAVRQTFTASHPRSSARPARRGQRQRGAQNTEDEPTGSPAPPHRGRKGE